MNTLVIIVAVAIPVVVVLVFFTIAAAQIWLARQRARFAKGYHENNLRPTE